MRSPGLCPVTWRPPAGVWLASRATAPGTGMMCGTARDEFVYLRVAVQVDRAVVGDHGVERAVGERENLLAGADVESRAALRAEVRVVDDIADDRRRA